MFAEERPAAQGGEHGYRLRLAQGVPPPDAGLASWLTTDSADGDHEEHGRGRPSYSPQHISSSTRTAR